MIEYLQPKVSYWYSCVARSGCGGGGTSFSAATGWVPANIPEDIVTNEVDAR